MSLVMCSPAAVPTDGGFRPEADFKQKIPRVALPIESSRSYGRGILRGIADYLKVCGPWSIFHEERSLGVPTVDLFARYELEGMPSFDDDEQAIGRLAAEHLRQRGFRHFGFFGCPGVQVDGHYRDGGPDFGRSPAVDSRAGLLGRVDPRNPGAAGCFAQHPGAAVSRAVRPQPQGCH